MADQRIYKVTGINASYLVQASSQAQALRHVAGKEYQVEVAKAVDVAQIMTKGGKVEIAMMSSEQVELPLAPETNEGAQA